MPRATVNRLVSGKTPDPRTSTIKAIAEYFDVSVEQVLGKQPLFNNDKQNTIKTNAAPLPIIDWNSSKNWKNITHKLKPDNHCNWIMADPYIMSARADSSSDFESAINPASSCDNSSVDGSKNAGEPLPKRSNEGKFAIKVQGESMWPQFQENTILIIDTDKQPKNKDFVIAYIRKDDAVIFRQLTTKGSWKFLKATNHIFPIIQMDNKYDKIIGVIIQTRNNYT